ncbi:MAG TPA: hypothetical protein PLJ62_10935 [Thermoflexales bacterium]|nr:hypothetical protein [Thermoflexales bacterium]
MAQGSPCGWLFGRARRSLRALRFWLARLVAEQQVQTDRIVDALAAVEAAARDGRG